MQTKMPRFHDAHLGCLFLLQSQHDLFDSSFKRLFSIDCAFAFRSAAAFGRLVDMLVAVVAH